MRTRPAADGARIAGLSVPSRLLAVPSRQVGHAAQSDVLLLRQSFRSASMLCWLRHRPCSQSPPTSSSVANGLAPCCRPGRQRADAVAACCGRCANAEGAQPTCRAVSVTSLALRRRIAPLPMRRAVASLSPPGCATTDALKGQGRQRHRATPLPTRRTAEGPGPAPSRPTVAPPSQLPRQRVAGQNSQRPGASARRCRQRAARPNNQGVLASAAVRRRAKQPKGLRHGGRERGGHERVRGALRGQARRRCGGRPYFLLCLSSCGLWILIHSAHRKNCAAIPGVIETQSSGFLKKRGS